MLAANELYERLLAAYGTPPWWSDNPVTVMAQAVMVQNTSWAAVERATERLAEPLTAEYLYGLADDDLAKLIRPSGFAKRKATTIKSLMMWYKGYDFNQQTVEREAQGKLRTELLAIKGIGEETADAILLYAFHKPAFVLDAYTRRVMGRLGATMGTDDERRAYFTGGLPRDYTVYGSYHWLILEHGKAHCRKTPLCDTCPLSDICAYLSR